MHRRGGVLPDGARRSPDASWISLAAVEGVDAAAMNRYWHVCPAFVEELRSPTARLTTLCEKMLERVEHGAELAWLVDPERRVVEVYRAGREPETVSGTEFVEGEGGGDWVPVGVGSGLGAFGEEVELWCSLRGMTCSKVLPSPRSWARMSSSPAMRRSPRVPFVVFSIGLLSRVTLHETGLGRSGHRSQ